MKKPGRKWTSLLLLRYYASMYLFVFLKSEGWETQCMLGKMGSGVSLVQLLLHKMVTRPVSVAKALTLVAPWGLQSTQIWLAVPLSLFPIFRQWLLMRRDVRYVSVYQLLTWSAAYCQLCIMLTGDSEVLCDPPTPQLHHLFGCWDHSSPVTPPAGW